MRVGRQITTGGCAARGNFQGDSAISGLLELWPAPQRFLSEQASGYQTFGWTDCCQYLSLRMNIRSGLLLIRILGNAYNVKADFLSSSLVSDELCIWDPC